MSWIEIERPGQLEWPPLPQTSFVFHPRYRNQSAFKISLDAFTHWHASYYLKGEHQVYVYLSIKPYKICLPCQTALNRVTSTSTMRRFTELLLLVACTLPRFFVNGFEALQPLIKNNVLRADAMIRGLLDPRQFFCENSGYALCSNDNFCCPIDWVCCIGSSLLSSSSIVELKFRRLW